MTVEQKLEVRNPAIPRLALSQEEAADALGVSTSFFVEYVRPELRVVLRGRRRLYPVRELERWLEANASRAVEGAHATGC